MEDAFRIQPRIDGKRVPNYGRKVLVFSDSRADAARIAADLNRDHSGDVFRQLMIRVLYGCPACLGEGRDETNGGCEACGGSGCADEVRALDYDELRDRVLALAQRRQIDISSGRIDRFFSRLDEEGTDSSFQRSLEEHFAASLRRDLSDEAFGLEPLGLASWQLKLRRSPMLRPGLK